MNTKTNATATATPCADGQRIKLPRRPHRKHTMMAGLVEPSSSPFGFGGGASVALAAMGTGIVRPGGIPPRSNNCQGRTPRLLLVFRSLYGVRMDANIFDSSSEVIQKVEGKSIGVKQVDASWRNKEPLGRQARRQS